MNTVRAALDQWQAALCREVPVGGVFARDPEVHRWKAPLRSLILREATAWRAHDLLQQAVLLSEASHLLGARILVRSAIETLATLAYLNQITRAVVSEEISYKDFSDKTVRLLLGSKNKSTSAESINIITVLGKVEKRIPGLTDVYADLSESAHPNYDGTAKGYGTIDHAEFTTHFSNKWAREYAPGFESFVRVTAHLYQVEYDEEWTDAWECLEAWMRTHPDKLPQEPRVDA
jgi:hypothetical protein